MRLHFFSERGILQIQNTVRLDDGVREETTSITSEKGLSINYDEACKKAVAERNAEPVTDYVTRFDATTGKEMKAYADGRVKYVLDLLPKRRSCSCLPAQMVPVKAQ